MLSPTAMRQRLPIVSLELSCAMGWSMFLQQPRSRVCCKREAAVFRQLRQNLNDIARSGRNEYLGAGLEHRFNTWPIVRDQRRAACSRFKHSHARRKAQGPPVGTTDVPRTTLYVKKLAEIL